LKVFKTILETLDKPLINKEASKLTTLVTIFLIISAESGLTIFNTTIEPTIYINAVPIDQVIFHNCDDTKNNTNIKSKVFLSIN
jgi:hypothetical protein